MHDTGAGSRVGPRGDARNVLRGAGSGKSLVSLESLRVLSSSKVTQVPARHHTKGAGKKGAGKKGGGKKGTVPATERFAAIYLGCLATKQIYHVLAYGDYVDKLIAYVGLDGQPVVNIKDIERLPGKDDLRCTHETVITTCLEATHGASEARFAYDVTEVTKHLATKETVTNAFVGTVVDLVIRIDSADEGQIQSGQNQGAPFLRVAGVDMDGERVGPLRLWDYAEGDLDLGSICILRGLKVASAKVWDEPARKWVINVQGEKTLDCDVRMAIEDVSDNAEIASYFS